MNINLVYFLIVLVLPLNSYGFGIGVDTIEEIDANQNARIILNQSKIDTYNHILSQENADKAAKDDATQKIAELENENREIAQQEESNVNVEPSIQTGDDTIKPSINVRYTEKFSSGFKLTGLFKLTSIDSTKTGDEAASSFAVDGGNVNFGLKGDWTTKFGSENIEGIFGLSFTYSSVSLGEVDVASGGTFDVKNELLTTGLSYTLGFSRKFYLGIQHSYHDLTGNETETDFSNSIDHERSTVVTVILPIGNSDRSKPNKYLFLERASPIGDSNAQIRLSYVTTLNFL